MTDRTNAERQRQFRAKRKLLDQIKVDEVGPLRAEIAKLSAGISMARKQHQADVAIIAALTAKVGAADVSGLNKTIQDQERRIKTMERTISNYEQGFAPE